MSEERKLPTEAMAIQEAKNKKASRQSAPKKEMAIPGSISVICVTQGRLFGMAHRTPIVF